MQIAECRLHYAVFSNSHWLLVSRYSPVVARYHSLANRHSCSTPAETQDGKCFSGWQGRYDQLDLPDVIILLKVIVSLFC